MRNRANALFLLCSLLLAMPSMAQEAQLSFKSTQLVPGLHMLEGVGGFTGGNLGLLVGEDGVILIDDSLPPLAETMLEAIAKVSPDPVNFVINTHVHGDHTGGNQALGQAGAHIVAHDNIRKRMVEQGINLGNGPQPAPKEALPVLTFADAVTFHLNGQDAYVFHVANAHTDGDAVIHFRSANVIHTGDVMFNGMFPFIDLNSGGSVDGYIAAQQRILALTDRGTKIIPGHGPLASAGDLKAAVDMLKDARDRVAKLVREGNTVEEIVAANPLEKYQDWNWQFITTERMIQTIYNDLSN